MCGRSSLTVLEKELEKRFNSTFYSEDLERYNPLPNYNVAPTHMHPVITNLDQDHIQYFRWGLIPFWAKDVKVGYKMINARKETLLEKRTFKNAVEKKRCIVPFDGFYEWKKTSSGKQPYRIITTNTTVFSVAGLWERWSPKEGEDIFSFTLITQEPNELMADIHNRMPAILDPDQERDWLNMDISSKDAIESLQPYPSDLMKAYPVTTRVGKVSENDEALIEEIEIKENKSQQNTLDFEE